MRLSSLSLALFAVALLASCAYVSAQLDPSWQDTETTTGLFGVITNHENDKLKTMLAEDEDLASVRAADGRGPLWWAHEANNEEAIEILKNAGADENWQDADGKTCKDFTHGEMTEYMKKLDAARAAQEEENRRRLQEQASMDHDDDEDSDEDEDDDDDDDDDDDEDEKKK